MDTSILLVIVAAIVLGIVGFVITKKKKTDEDSIGVHTKIDSPIDTAFIKVTKPHHTSKVDVVSDASETHDTSEKLSHENIFSAVNTDDDEGFTKTIVLSKVLQIPVSELVKEQPKETVEAVPFENAENNVAAVDSGLLNFTPKVDEVIAVIIPVEPLTALPIEPELQGAHILLVDDSKLVRIKTEKFLVSNGYTVTTAIDGIDALEKMKNNEEYDIVITDIEMPNMDGFGLCKKIRENEFYEHTPIMVMSSHTNLHLELSAQSKINGFVPKPYNEQEMLDQINYLVKK